MGIASLRLAIDGGDFHVDVVAVAAVFQLGTILAEHRSDVEMERAIGSCLCGAAGNGFAAPDTAPPVDGGLLGTGDDIADSSILHRYSGVGDG